MKRKGKYDEYLGVMISKDMKKELGIQADKHTMDMSTMVRIFIKKGLEEL